MGITANETVDAKGLACPMPIVKTKKAISDLAPGQVMEVQATDKGSTADIKAWAESTGHQYLGTVEEDDVLKHYLRKASDDEVKNEANYDDVIDLQVLRNKVDGLEDVTILDVREQAEYAFNHIPGAINVPLGELENRMDEINTDKEIHVICRTGSRSDLAAQKLSQKGFKIVKNVVPGMAEWDGPTEKSTK
ncbi:MULTISPECIES: sulfurtransferase TusA family protein [Bacillaceae]|uniref:sulfurtransferase TusA family protein n=1 Tax=Bacillaceae TaxID=186817 RepID=UPI0019096C57|nr:MULTISPECIES: sulfurtransferase TusA family protein [Bacillaceae]MBR3120100.1 sulfurtransferase TusA family protein [Oceanobacillus sp.]MBR3198350.1 sulfurtransferase TusA family protein [Methanobrevibacter sp.]HLS08187.1 sulfurtransferase TusA family protein [Lentibacillus sp.]